MVLFDFDPCDLINGREGCPCVYAMFAKWVVIFFFFLFFFWLISKFHWVFIMGMLELKSNSHRKWRDFTFGLHYILYSWLVRSLGKVSNQFIIFLDFLLKSASRDWLLSLSSFVLQCLIIPRLGLLNFNFIPRVYYPNPNWRVNLNDSNRYV